ncbi:MAG: D-2-hydroxyacid dehydrogenase [Sphingobium sp.]|nr:D-2-hydroxyacid dehydrogenase [Sphingobium sp.]
MESRDRLTLVAPAPFRGMVGGHIPDAIDVRWFASVDEAVALAPLADMGWFDMPDPNDIGAAVAAATKMRWLSTIYAGLDMLPTSLLAERGVIVTNGRGLNSAAVADYAMLGVLALAKRYDQVVRLADRQQWTMNPPGTGELAGSRALVIGMGTIGEGIARRLIASDVLVTGVRRQADGRAGIIGADAWRARLGEFDWVILIAPSTAETRAMFGAAEFAAMKPGAAFINMARGDMVDQDALIAGLKAGRPGAAFLDVAFPEPLPPGHPLWSAPNCLLSLHLSGRSQQSMVPNGVRRFIANLGRYLAGEPLEHVVDPAAGY